MRSSENDRCRLHLSYYLQKGGGGWSSLGFPFVSLADHLPVTHKTYETTSMCYLGMHYLLGICHTAVLLNSVLEGQCSV